MPLIRRLLFAFVLLLAVWPAVACAQDSLHFGLFRYRDESPDYQSLHHLNAQWAQRSVFPLSSPFWYLILDADRAVESAGLAGLELSLVFSSATGDSLSAYLPPDSALWDTLVTGIVERYDGDGVGDMKNLRVPVKTWHVEEETSFWKDTDEAYIEYFRWTARAIRRADSTAQVALMGLGTQMLWNAAFFDGYVSIGPPPGMRVAQDDPGLIRFRRLVTYMLAENNYDVTDLHLFITEPVVKGLVEWLQARTPLPERPVWVYEAGAPFETVANGYTDSLQACFTAYMIGDALANGVDRIALQYFYPSPDGLFSDEPFVRIALVDSVAVDSTTGRIIPSKTKPAYETYALLAEKLAGYTSVTDESSRGVGRDTSNVYYYSFLTPTGVVGLVWAYPDTVPAYVRVNANQGLLRVTHIPTRRGVSADDAHVEYIAYIDSLARITIGPGPVLIELGGVFVVGVDEAPHAASLDAPRISVFPFVARSHVALRARAPGGRILLTTASGRMIRTLALPHADAETTIEWDLTDDGGRPVPAGTYWASLAGDQRRRHASRCIVVR